MQCSQHGILTHDDFEITSTQILLFFKRKRFFDASFATDYRSFVNIIIYIDDKPAGFLFFAFFILHTFASAHAFCAVIF